MVTKPFVVTGLFLANKNLVADNVFVPDKSFVTNKTLLTDKRPSILDQGRRCDKKCRLKYRRYFLSRVCLDVCRRRVYVSFR